jgi:flagellar biosynthesis/type III secretory pathway ATPase
MGYAPKVALCVPLKNSDALKPFVEDCLCDKVVLIAVVGDGCRHVEDLIDEIVVVDGADDSRFIVTTSHPQESIEDTIGFAAAWVREDGRDCMQEVTV